MISKLADHYCVTLDKNREVIKVFVVLLCQQRISQLRSRIYMRYQTSGLSIILVMIILMSVSACSSSSNSEEQLFLETEADENDAEEGNDSVTDQPADDDANVNLEHLFYIDENSIISVNSGTIRIVPILDVGETVSVTSIEVLNAPDWISINANNNLLIAPPASLQGGVKYEFSIKVVLTNGNDAVQEIFQDTYAVTSLRTVLASGIMPASGGEITSEWLDVIFRSDGGLDTEYQLSFLMVEAGLASYSFSVEAIPELSDADKERITIEHDSIEELYLNYSRFPDVDEEESQSSARNIVRRQKLTSVVPHVAPAVCRNESYEKTDFTAAGYLMDKLWWGRQGAFVDTSGPEGAAYGTDPRILPSNENRVTGPSSINRYVGRMHVMNECASALQSTLGAVSEEAFEGREPVLLIHGLVPNGSLGGTDYYFGNLPGMIQELNMDGREFFPLTFRWQTNTRFEVAANDLRDAIEVINEVTGKKVHIVAHSFGGVLIRTLLQGISIDSEGSALSNIELENMIASVTTVGSPHSGIFSGTTEYEEDSNYWVFNGGFSSSLGGVLARACGTVTCHQLGQEYVTDQLTLSNEEEETLDELIGIDGEPVGKLAYELATTYPNSYPDIPTNVLIGSQVYVGHAERIDDRYTIGYIVRPDDGLISSYGQLWRANTNRGLLSNIMGKQVSEIYLGHEPFISEGSDLPDFNESFRHDFWVIDVNTENVKGYEHSSKWGGGSNFTQVAFKDCQPINQASCGHAAWQHLKDLLSRTEEQGAEVTAVETITLTGRVEANSLPIGGVSVSATTAGGDAFATLTNESGIFNLPVVFTANSEIRLIVEPSNSGVITSSLALRNDSFNIQTFDSVGETSGDVGVIQLLDSSVVTGSVLVSVNDASTGVPLNSFTYSIVSSSGVMVVRGNSGVDYSVEHTLPHGDYTVEVQSDGYNGVTGYSCTVTSLQAQCTPTVDPSDYVAIGGMSAVLTWAENPSDLDSHLIKYSNSSPDYHVYFSNRSESNASLDVDDTSGFGPETISVQSLETGAGDRYIYAVRHFSGSGSITSSAQAQVRVSIGDSGTRVFSAPTNESSSVGDYWKVFEVQSGRLLPCLSGCIYSSIARMEAQPLARDGHSLNSEFSSSWVTSKSMTGDLDNQPLKY